MGKRILIIGAGAAGSVVAKKCVTLPDVFSDIHIASRTLSKCMALADACNHKLTPHQIDADDTQALITLLREIKPFLVINMALPYQDLSIMDACLETNCHYIDTANYEPKDEAKFCYKWQWDYQERFKEKKLMALLGSGFDPGVTNVFCAYAQKHLFDSIESIDIVDCNAGDHGHPFATNFNPEINIREITQKGKYWKEGQWIETAPLSIKETINFPEVGPKDAYLMYHEELESLILNIKGLKQIRFFMTFSEQYLTYLDVLQNVGMTGIKPIDYNGQQIVPLQFLKAVLPEPSSLSENYTGKTSIGCIITGTKNGKRSKKIIYNCCEHQKTHAELQAQAVSYTTGVPAMIGAKQLIENTWLAPGVWNMEQLDPDSFMKDLNTHGLDWHIKDL